LQAAYHERVERHDHKLDLLGAALLTGAVLALLVSTRSRAIGAWAVPAALALGAGFVAVERRAREPLLPLDLLGQRVIGVASAVGALVGAAMIATVSFVPLYVQSVLGGSATAAGAAIAPMAIGWPVASALSGRLLHRVGYRPLIRVGLGVSALAALAMALWLRPGIPPWGPRLIMAVYGVGLGLSNTPTIIAVQTSVPWSRRGVATASTMFFRTIGGTVAVGILGGLLAASLSGSSASPEQVEQLLGPERSLLAPALVASLAGALQAGMARVFWAAAAIAGLAFSVGLAFPKLAPEGTSGAPVGGVAAKTTDVT
ncbi:MAG TPA: MFS transporter, partial [Anaeromyxobacteraceae bacterium]|nr:MFS transporter [Anaeromyxobacteraceae bacterium]